MSCETLNQQTVTMNVSMGSLPEGFCPASWQEGANAMAARLLVTPSQGFTSFVAGSVEPTSNVGPWLKDCEEWFIWSDTQAKYVPTEKGFTNQQYFISSTSFVVPEFVYKIRATAWGAGGGGGAAAAGSPGGGGGGGGYVQGIFNVVPFQVIPLVIGVGGAPGTNGGNTTVLTMTATGGVTGVITDGGLGGSGSGGIVNLVGQVGSRVISGVGGDGGDGAGAGGGGGTEDTLARPSSLNGTAPAGGGVGGDASGTSVAGNGANGAVLLEY